MAKKKMRPMKPMGQRIIVRRHTADEKTPGGVILPEMAKEVPKCGTVTHVSEDVDKIKVGDEVLFTAYAGTEIQLDGKRLLIMQASDVLVVV